MVANFWSSTIVLDKDGHLLPFCSSVQSGTGKSYMSIFSAILAGPGRFLLRSRKVATMAVWSNDFSSLLANVLKTFLVKERQVSAVLTY